MGLKYIETEAFHSNPLSLIGIISLHIIQQKVSGWYVPSVLYILSCKTVEWHKTHNYGNAKSCVKSKI